MKILHYDVPDWQKIILTELLFEHENRFIDKNSVNVDFTGIEVVTLFIHNIFETVQINNFPDLKLIVTRSTGFDHIDLESAKQKNISVTNVPEYGSETIAEHAFSLLLAIAKNIPEIHTRILNKDFSYQDYLGFELEGKIFGLIGTGKIGLHAAKIAKGFNMNIKAFDIFQNTVAAKEIDFSYCELDDVLSSADIISLHLPLNEHTKEFINKEKLTKMKRGCVFLNVSRGGLIKNEDLLWALENNILRAAGLDVLNNEENMIQNQPDSIQSILLNNPKVLYTPHSAYFTKEALTRILETSAKNIISFNSGNIINQVNKK